MEDGMSKTRAAKEPSGDQFREIGGRLYKIRPDEVLVGKRGRWELFEYTAWSDWPWVSLRLLDTHKQVSRRVYQIGYNIRDRRVARNACWSVIQEKYPDAADWIVATMIVAARSKRRG